MLLSVCTLAKPSNEEISIFQPPYIYKLQFEIYIVFELRHLMTDIIR